MRRFIGTFIDLASHRLISWLRWSFALALVLGLVPRVAHAAPKESDSESPTAGAVYFDPDTMRFAGPLDTDSKRTAKVFTLLPGNSREVELIYWPKGKDEACPNQGEPKTLEQAKSAGWDLPADAVRRAALRGNQNGDRFEFIASVGPLRINVKYCFHLEAKTPKELSKEQKQQISTALRDTLKAAKTWVTKDDSPHAVDCKQSKALSGRPLSRCELAMEFAAQLTKQHPDAATWEVAASDGSTTLSLPQAFEQALLLRPDFKDALNLALSNLVGAIPSLETYASGRATLGGLAGSSYDPLSGLDLADVARAAPASVRKKYKELDAATPRAEWAKLLWSDRNAFITAKAWNKLAGQKKDTLRDFFMTREGAPRDGQPPMVAFSTGDIQAIFTKMPKDKPIKENLRAVENALEKLPTGVELLGLPKGPGLTEVVSYYGVLSALQPVIAQILSADEGLATLVAGDSPTAEFLATLQRLAPVQSFGAFAWEPTLEQRFPLYASADLGLAGTLIPIRDRDPRLDVVAYFGVNLYFTAVDKDEPVRRSKDDISRGRNFLRRFALTGGFSVIRPRLNRDLGIAGILRNQVLLFGAGYRVFDYLRVGGGVMLYQQQSPNPLSDKTLLRTSPYISLSMDIDVIGTIRGWYDKANGYTN